MFMEGFFARLSYSTILLFFCLVFAIYGYNRYLIFVSEDEEIFIKDLTSERIIKGPNFIFINPLITKKFRLKKRISLGENEYLIVKNRLTGKSRNEIGPKLFTHDAYDVIQKTGNETTTRVAISLKTNEYVRLFDEKTGDVRVIRGDEIGKVIPNPHEVLMDSIGILKAWDLKIFEYIKILNKSNGDIRTVSGEQLVFLGPFDEVIGNKKLKGYELDDNTAVLVRNKETGQQNLVTGKRLFFPTKDEEVVETRELIQLADYEACIVRDQFGKDNYYFGSNDQERSFFLPAYSKLVTLCWSRGRRRVQRDLKITKIDLRPMFMSFEFNCRTKDNVDLILEGSFFWEIINLQNMMKFTNNTTGDVCNHARSRFIELVSKVTLQQFMDQFNIIAENVHKKDKSNFYAQRGVKIHSLEVTGYKCAEESTAQILEQIIQETTNRMNRLQQQESENEVQLRQINGDIQEELARQKLISLQTENDFTLASMEGKKEGERIKSFLNSIDGIKQDTALELWKILRKEDQLKAVSGKGTTLYFTPRDADLSIEHHQHA